MSSIVSFSRVVINDLETSTSEPYILVADDYEDFICAQNNQLPELMALSKEEVVGIAVKNLAGQSTFNKHNLPDIIVHAMEHGAIVCAEFIESDKFTSIIEQAEGYEH